MQMNQTLTLTTIQKCLLGIGLIIGLSSIRFIRFSADQSMQPTVGPFDPMILWSIDENRPLRAGDLLWMKDPLDPEKMLIRRLIALPGQQISIRDSVVTVNQKALYQVDMDLDKSSTFRHFEERDRGARMLTHLIRHRIDTVPWSADATVIPDDHLYVMCDDRDQCLDSRWWGPVPKTLVLGHLEPFF